MIALVNQKGGCGKTTTAVNLAACVAVTGRRVLLIDLDPQANATVSLGVDPASLSRTVYNVLVDDFPEKGTGLELPGVITPSNVANLDIVPSSIDLAAAELELAPRLGRENALRKKLATVLDRYDYIFLDTPPSLGLLTLNALVACEEVVIPIQTHYYALLGVGQLLQTLKAVRGEIGHQIEIAGVVPTMYDARTSISKEIVQSIRKLFSDKVFESTIHFDIKLVEASMVGVPVFVHDPASRGAQEYATLAKEVMAIEDAPRRAAAPSADAEEVLQPAQTTPAQPLVAATADPGDAIAATRTVDNTAAAQLTRLQADVIRLAQHMNEKFTEIGKSNMVSKIESLAPRPEGFFRSLEALVSNHAELVKMVTQLQTTVQDETLLRLARLLHELKAPRITHPPPADAPPRMPDNRNSVPTLSPPAGAHAPGTKMVGVVDFCAPATLETFENLLPQRLAADDFANLLARAAEERFEVIPRAMIQQAEAAMKWREEDVRSVDRLRALARAVRADWLVVGWIPMLSIQPGAGGTRSPGNGHRRLTGEASVVVQIFDADQGRVVAEVRQWVSTGGDVRPMLAEQVLHRALEPTVSSLISMLAARAH